MSTILFFCPFFLITDFSFQAYTVIKILPCVWSSYAVLRAGIRLGSCNTQGGLFFLIPFSVVVFSCPSLNTADFNGANNVNNVKLHYLTPE